MAPADLPAPGGGSPPLTEDSLRWAESTGASFDHMVTSIIPYLTAMARHQVQLNVAPPLHGDVHTQRRLKTAIGFDEVLAAVQPLPDALSALRDRRLLRAAQAEAAAAVRSVASEIMGRESVEAYLKAANAEVEALRKDVKVLRESNVKNDVMLTSAQSTMEQHSEDLKRLHSRDAFIATLNKKPARERDVYKSSIGANTEQARKIHLLLIKLSKGKYVDNDTRKALENQQARDTILHQVNRTLRGHVSLAGMNPEVLRLAVDDTFHISATNVRAQSLVTGLTAGELDLEALDLDQETLVALQRIQAAAASSNDHQALPAALAQTAHQVAHGKHHKRLRPGGKESDNESDDSDEERPPSRRIRPLLVSVMRHLPLFQLPSLHVGRCSAQGMEASGSEEAPEDSPSFSRQVAPASFEDSGSVCIVTSSLMVATSHASIILDSRRCRPQRGVPSAHDIATESSGKAMGSGAHDDVSGLPDAPSYLPQGPSDVAKPPASTISPSPADIRAAEKALREAEQFRLMFGSSD
ncbi:hypothetical protein PInf_027027 [Phytophthora infestans]|nr:hypothetical protein PInf_027027 [Phytophthora infestans]